MTDISSLNIKSDSSQVKTSTKDLDNLAKSAQKAEAATSGFTKATGAATTASQKESATVRNVSQELDREATATQKAALAQERLAQSKQRVTLAGERLRASTLQSATAMGRAELAAQKYRDELAKQQDQEIKNEASHKRLSGAFSLTLRSVLALAAGFTALSAIRTADQMTNLEGRIRLSTRSVEEATEAWKGLTSISRETGSDLEASVSIFQRLSFVRDEIKATTGEMLQFTDTVTKLGISSGASGDAMKFGLTQLGQSLSSSIVRAEEFNSIMENIPGVGKAIADQLGITTGQLRNLVINGEVLSKDVFTAILASTQKANEQYAQMDRTATRAAREAFVNFGLVASELDKTFGISQKIAAVIDQISEALRTMTVLVIGAANAFMALKNASDIDSKQLDISLGERYNRWSDENGGQIAGIKLGKFDLSNRKAEIAALTDSTAKLPTYQETYNKMFPEKQTPLATDSKGGPTVEAAQVEALQKKYQGLVKTIGDKDKASDKAAKAAEKQLKLEEDTIDDLVFRNQQLLRSADEQERFNQLRRANVDIDTEAGQKISILVDEYNRLKKETEQLERVTEDLSDSFGDAFGDFIKGTKDAKEAFKSLVDDLQDILIQETITGPIKSIFKDLISGGGGGSSSSGGLSNILSSLTGAATKSSGGGIGSWLGQAGSWVSSLFGFADGGSFKVGGNGGTDSQLVAFRASPDETVSISRPDQQQGGGVVNNWHVDNRGASVEAVQRMEQIIQRVDASVERRALNAVDTKFKRDPTYGRRV